MRGMIQDSVMQQIIVQHLSRDTVLRSVLESTPFPALKAEQPDVYSNLIRAIISQQLSVKAADAIHRRFLGLFPGAYPEPGEILDMSIDALRSAGLSRQKAGYVQNIARYFLDKQLLRRTWTGYEDESILQELTPIKGVGRWTVEMILIFTLRRSDVFPVDDLGIRRMMIDFYEVDEQLPKRQLYRELTEIAEAWRPYRSYACRYLWRWKDQR